MIGAAEAITLAVRLRGAGIGAWREAETGREALGVGAWRGE